jgi:hypothetical protein
LSDQSAGWEYAEVDGRAIGIRRLVGYDSQLPSTPFLGYSNLNLAYRYSEFPIVHEQRGSASPRPLAAVSLVRPSSFDPAGEFAEISARPQGDGAFLVSLPDSEIAYVSLRDRAGSTIRLGEYTLEGSDLRLARLKPDGSSLCALGIHRASGIAELAAPGTLALHRDGPETASLGTDTGVMISESWLGRGIQQVEVQDLGGDWTDVTGRCSGGAIPHELVQEWSARSERSLVQFRIRL